MAWSSTTPATYTGAAIPITKDTGVMPSGQPAVYGPLSATTGLYAFQPAPGFQTLFGNPADTYTQ